MSLASSKTALFLTKYTDMLYKCTSETKHSILGA